MAIDFVEIFRRGFASFAADMFTAEVCEVKSYDNATQTADLQPIVKVPVPSAEGTVLFEELPEIPNVPILFLRSSSAGITFPILVGDYVLGIVLTRSIADWRRTGQVSEPSDLRERYIGNMVAIAGLAPDSEALDYATTDSLVIHAQTILLHKEATDMVAIARLCNQNYDDIKTALLSHKHTGVQAGTGTTGGSDSAYIPTDVSATVVKAK